MSVTIYGIVGYGADGPTGIMSFGPTPELQRPAICFDKNLALNMFKHLKDSQKTGITLGPKGTCIKLLEFRQHEIMEEFFSEAN